LNTPEVDECGSHADIPESTDDKPILLAQDDESSLQSGLILIAVVIIPPALLGIIVSLSWKFGPWNILRENQALEWIEAVMAACAACAFFISARANPLNKQIRIILGILLCAIVMRELDTFIEDGFFKGEVSSYYGAIYVFLIATALYTFTRPRKTWTSLKDFIPSKACLIFAFGFTLIFGVAQVLGQRHFLRRLLKGLGTKAQLQGSSAIIKDFVEESIELLGYFFFLFSGIVDTITRTRQRRQDMSRRESTK